MLHSEGLWKIAWTSSPSYFWRFPSFARGSELCEAQETRGSKFIYEFGRNSTVYCFVASENKTAPTRKIRNLSHFLKVYQRVEIYNFAFSTRWGRPMAAPTKLYNLLQNRRGEHCSPLIFIFLR